MVFLNVETFMNRTPSDLIKNKLSIPLVVLKVDMLVLHPHKVLAGELAGWGS